MRALALALLLCLAAAAAAVWIDRRGAPRPLPAPGADASAELVPVPGRRAAAPEGSDAELAPEPLPPAVLAAAADERAPWAAANAQAIAALEAGDVEGAIAGFEACLAAMPEEPVLQRNLAEALVRRALRDHAGQRSCAECPALLARALELAPERAELAALRERWLAELSAEEGFWRESSLHFELAYDGSRDELLWGSARLLELLEEAYTDYGELFGRYPADGGAPRIAVKLYPRESFARLTGLGDWAGGAFDGSVRVPVGDFELEEPVLRRVLRHELVHVFALAAGGASVPGWLNEGLAQWLDDGRAESLARARQGLAGRELYPLERLQGSLAAWSDAEEIAAAYAQSLLLADTVARQYGERVLFAMIEACGAGSTPAERFRELTGVELDTLLEDLAGELSR